jgi:hypothetical protein
MNEDRAQTFTDPLMSTRDTTLGKWAFGQYALANVAAFIAMLLLPVVMFNPEGGNPWHYLLIATLFAWALWAALVIIRTSRLAGKILGVIAGLVAGYMLKNCLGGLLYAVLAKLA